MVSIKDVAQRAGVSISTVSNVLNGTKFVSETLRRRVMTAVEELGYQASPIARSMKSSRSHTVGVISTDIGGLFYPYVIKGLYNRFSQSGYNVHVFETDGVHDPRSSWERVVDGVRHFVEYRVDGIVLTSVFPANMEAYYADRILKLVQNSGKDIAVVSTKSMTGHLLGGAGGVEGVFTALALHDAFLPATVNLQEPDPELDLDYVPNVGRKADLRYVLSNSLGFGGHNGTLIIKKYED